MKKTLKVVLCLALAVLMLSSAVVFAAEGDLDVLADTALDANLAITGTGGTLTVTVPTSLAATAGGQYVVLVCKVKAETVPAGVDSAVKLLEKVKDGTVKYDVGEDTILYIDQTAATASGVTFSGKPKSAADAVIVLGGGSAAKVLGVMKGHGVEVTGAVTVPGAADGAAFVEIWQGDTKIQETTATLTNIGTGAVPKGSGTYTLTGVPAGEYTLKVGVTGTKFVTHAYTIDTNAGPVQQDALVCAKGDIRPAGTPDGKLAVADVQAIFNNAGNKTNTLDAYSTLCADVRPATPDGKLAIADVQAVFNAILDTSKLW